MNFTNLLGIIKCKSAHNSFRLFCKGVPVISSLWLVSNSLRVLYNNESSFFSRCASSTISMAQETEPKNDLSFRTISYVVRTAFNFSRLEPAKHHSYVRIYKKGKSFKRDKNNFNNKKKYIYIITLA